MAVGAVDDARDRVDGVEERESGALSVGEGVTVVFWRTWGLELT